MEHLTGLLKSLFSIFILVFATIIAIGLIFNPIKTIQMSKNNAKIPDKLTIIICKIVGVGGMAIVLLIWVGLIANMIS